MALPITSPPATPNAAGASTPAPGATPPRSAVRPEIQALRGLAVALVVVYHLWPHGRLRGGYVGVDVFFVISGFLITGHLLREVERTGTVRLASFWARRARRLLPASFAVLAVVGLVTPLIVPEAFWGDWYHHLGASALYVENWALAQDSVNYLLVGNSATPFQHFWSLSAEEQFYLVWPLLIVATVLVSRRKAPAVLRRRILVALAVVVAASFVYSFHETFSNPQASYLVTPARGWEFGLGGLLAGAFAVRGHGARPLLGAQARTALSWLGLAAILGGALKFNSGTHFPGYAALVPVVGALAVIAAGAPDTRWSPAGLMRLRPVQFTGDISYSLYLWHWPLIVLMPYALSAPLTTGFRLAIIVASIGLAWASKVLIEDRVRSAPLLAARKPRWTFAAVAMVMAIVLVATGVVEAGVAHRASAAEKAVAALVDAPVPECLGATSIGVASCVGHSTGPLVPDPSISAVDLGGAFSPQCWVEEGSALKDCVSGDVGSHTKVALIGDSHAAAWYEPLRRLAVEHHWELHTFYKSACPFDDTAFIDTPTLERDCPAWTAKVEKAVVKSHFALVVTSASHSRYDWGTKSPRAIEAGYRSAWATIGRTGKLVVLRDVPTATSTALSCRDFRTQSAASCSVTTEQGLGGPVDYAYEAAKADRTPGVVPVDLTADFCWDGTCPTVIGGVIVYRDVSSHITSTYSITMTEKLGQAMAARGAMPVAAASN